MFWDTKNELKISDIYDNVGRLQNDIHEHREKLTKLVHDIDLLIARKPDYLSTEEKARIADLEVKMAKLWGLLIETTPLGKEKLSKFGRKFGGKSKENYN